METEAGQRHGGVALAERPPRSGRRREPSAGLASSTVRLTSVSWSAPKGFSFEQWVRDGRRLGTIGRGVGWWIGDWLCFGNAKYGEKYVQAAHITGYDVQTLMNMAYVASRVEPPRRRERLSWSHHAELAPLTPDEQNDWLDRASEERLSVQDLRQLLRQERRGHRGRDEPSPVMARTRRAYICPACGHPLAGRHEPSGPSAAVEEAADVRDD